MNVKNPAGFLVIEILFTRFIFQRRNIVEIVWPCAIFIILVTVREKRPPTYPNDQREFPNHIY